MCARVMHQRSTSLRVQSGEVVEGFPEEVVLKKERHEHSRDSTFFPRPSEYFIKND